MTTPPSSSSARARTAMLYAWVSFGSILGGLARYFTSLLLDFGPGFPWATLVINVLGSLIIGFYATLTGPDGRVLARPEHRQFVMTGFCGGYTTFSTFSLETFRLFHGGAKYTALAYIGASLIGWLTAVWLGHLMAGRYNRLKRS
jgi:CrcB protein